MSFFVLILSDCLIFKIMMFYSISIRSRSKRVKSIKGDFVTKSSHKGIHYKPSCGAFDVPDSAKGDTYIIN